MKTVFQEDDVQYIDKATANQYWRAKFNQDIDEQFTRSIGIHIWDECVYWNYAPDQKIYEYNSSCVGDSIYVLDSEDELKKDVIRSVNYLSNRGRIYFVHTDRQIDYLVAEDELIRFTDRQFTGALADGSVSDENRNAFIRDGICGWKGTDNFVEIGTELAIELVIGTIKQQIEQ